MRRRWAAAVVVRGAAVSSSASEAHSLHSLFDILNSIVTLTVVVSALIPVLMVVIVRLLSLRVSSWSTGTGVTVVHLLRSP